MQEAKRGLGLVNVEPQHLGDCAGPKAEAVVLESPLNEQVQDADIGRLETFKRRIVVINITRVGEH
ncbi:hypothetical protein ES703_30697 [subsurface metagenome]